MTRREFYASYSAHLIGGDMGNWQCWRGAVRIIRSSNSNISSHLRAAKKTLAAVNELMSNDQLNENN